MKRILSLLLIFACIFALSSCDLSNFEWLFAGFDPDADGPQSDNTAQTLTVCGVQFLTSGTLAGVGEWTAESGDDFLIAVYSESVPRLGNLFAPGTRSDRGLKISFTGVAGSDFTLETVADDEISDVFLGAGNWAVMSSAYGVTEDNFVAGRYYIRADDKYLPADSYSYGLTYYEAYDAVYIEEDYYPVLWTVTATGDSTPANADFTNESNLNEVIRDLCSAMQITASAGETVEAEYKISWEWPFSDSYEADTIIGALIANATDVCLANDDGEYVISAEGIDYCIDVNFGITVDMRFKCE